MDEQDRDGHLRDSTPLGSGEGGPLNDEEQTAKDMSYSPGSEREQARNNEDDRAEELARDGIDPAKVRTLPGAGGPDDVGDVDVPEEELNLPRNED